MSSAIRLKEDKPFTDIPGAWTQRDWSMRYLVWRKMEKTYVALVGYENLKQVDNR